MRPTLHLAALLASLLLSGIGPPAQAAAEKKQPAATAATGANRKASAPKFIPSTTQETPRDRDRRLLRECKGRPNAGACLGFSS